MIRRSVQALLVVALVIGVASPAVAAPIQNGGFETGDFSGWSHPQSGGGSWNVWSSDEGGCTGSLDIPLVGTYSAVADMGDDSRMALLQRFRVPSAGSPKLKLMLQYESDASFVAPNTFALDVDNQQLRIDVLEPDAKTWSLKDADVLRKVYRTDPGDPLDVGPIEIVRKLRPFRGENVKLRIAIALTDDCLGTVVDKIQVT